MNIQNQYDIIVVGAGPAGSIASEVAAATGVSVLLLEKDAQVGSPVRCAEGVGCETVEKLLQSPVPAEAISTTVSKYCFVAPDGTRIYPQVSLMGYILNRDIFDDMYYWAPADRSGMEVDFILVRGSKLIAVEAKSGKAFSDSWCKGLRAIEPLEGLQRRIVVYPHGPAMKTKDEIDVLPFKRFSHELAAGSL